MGEKPTNLPCDQYELDWHCNSTQLDSACAWNGTSCVGLPCNPVMNDSTLQTAIDLWVSDEAIALSTYCDISTWDTSSVTNMAYLFHRYETNVDYRTGSTANHNISSWDVS